MEKDLERIRRGLSVRSCAATVQEALPNAETSCSSAADAAGRAATATTEPRDQTGGEASDLGESFLQRYRDGESARAARTSLRDSSQREARYAHCAARACPRRRRLSSMRRPSTNRDFSTAARVACTVRASAAPWRRESPPPVRRLPRTTGPLRGPKSLL